MKRTTVLTGERNTLVINNFSDGFTFYKNITVDGTWALTDEHDLSLHILNSEYPALNGKTIIFKGAIERVDAGSLYFRVRSYENVLGIKTGTIALGGTWQADKYNRITFNIQKGRGQYDTLTFRGGWDINRSNELVYTYEKKWLKRRTGVKHVVSFKGSWEVFKNQLVYRLEGSSDSAFIFSAELAGGRFAFKDRQMRFNIGARYEKRSGSGYFERIVAIYGTWTLIKGLKARFDVEYADGRKKAIEFGIEKAIGRNGSLEIFLKDKEGEKLGVSVKFTKIFSNDAELFMAFSRAPKETRILGGLTVKF